MLTVTQTTGMAAEAKRAALKVLIVVVLISGTVNFLAPGALILRIIFAIVVALVAGVEWVAGKIRPDFAAIEHRENELTTPTNPVPAPAAETKPVDDPANIPAPALTAPPAITDRHPGEDIPARLVSAARMITVQHRQTSTQPMTADELAARLNIAPALAGQLLSSIDTPTPARLNGHTPVLGGVR
jgi:hypothetical protein